MDLKIGVGGQVSLPGDVCQRYGLEPDTSVRLIETPNAILLVPLKDSQVSESLAGELAQWQAAGQEAWDLFPYDEDE